MDKFLRIEGKAAGFDVANVDTDVIIPKQFLKTVERKGLSIGLFYDYRFDENGNRLDNFILDTKEYRDSKILISGANFGCGSSREHAPWALLDFGIRVIIAESFADIFYNNCFKNGILPIYFERGIIDELLIYASKSDNVMVIDLPSQEIRLKDSSVIRFTIDEFRKHCLLEGLDDIDLTLQKAGAISSFEAQNRKKFPWLW